MSSSTPTTLGELGGTYTLDPSHSRLGFVARHAMVTKVRGSFNDFEGHAVIDGNNLASSSAKVTIQAASIDTRNSDRDGHLRSNDFFAMEDYPELSFVATGVEQTGDANLELTGDLTIKGTTNPVTVPFEFQGGAVDPFGNERIGFEGALTINRQDFGIAFNAPLETGGVLVSDKVTLELEISAIKTA